MKKFIGTAIIILGISLAMVLIGSVLQGITIAGTGFDMQYLSKALVNVGYIAAVLSGIVLTGLGVAFAVKNDEGKK